ncbi:Conserved protein of unknown function [Magnetospira sp. QH-2]|nr:Conserved protein of unknown function [Magnetospira sp. QH-2]
MENLMKQAFDALHTLPEADQQRIAYEIIERVEDKSEWDGLVASPEAQDWLEWGARKVLKIYAKATKKMAMQFVTIPLDGMQRSGAYWDSFEELPGEIRKLAEKNFKTWKTNPNAPGLRFKQIHKDLPVYSFRVGMKHRTVGVEAEDGALIWFWVGSFETFAAASVA